MDKPKGYVDPQYLQLVGEWVRQNKLRSYELMRIRPGDRVLDVGCGPGTDTIPLAQLVGPSGKVVGIDYDPAMVAEAERLAAEAGVAAWVEHKQGDATSLPFEDGAFAACRSERLFQHLPEPLPGLVLSEMVRVTRSGGWVVVVDTEYGTVSLDSDEVDIERRLSRVLAERLVNNGYAARKLYRLLKQLDMSEVAVELHPSYVTDYAMGRAVARMDEAERVALEEGIITPEELRRWHKSLDRADAEGVFFGSVCSVIAAGRKP